MRCRAHSRMLLLVSSRALHVPLVGEVAGLLAGVRAASARPQWGFVVCPHAFTSPILHCVQVY
jgi:hypothetical protein